MKFHCFPWLLICFQRKRKSSQQRKGNPMDEALISLLDNASLKFLMPSRRHHPHVEPLLATYKIFHIKWWLNHFWSLQETSFITKLLILEVLWRHHVLWLIFTIVSLLNSEILLFSLKKKTAENSIFHQFSLLLRFIINLLFIPFFLIKFLYFPLFPISLHKSPFIRFKTPF